MTKGAQINILEGKVNYSLKVLEKIIKQNVPKVRGVEGLDQSTDEGIRIESKKNVLSLRLYVILNLERRVPEVAWDLQKHLKDILEKKMGLRVEKIDIYVTAFSYSNPADSSPIFSPRTNFGG